MAIRFIDLSLRIDWLVYVFNEISLNSSKKYIKWVCLLLSFFELWIIIAIIIIGPPQRKDNNNLSQYVYFRLWTQCVSACVSVYMIRIVAVSIHQNGWWKREKKAYNKNIRFYIVLFCFVPKRWYEQKMVQIFIKINFT